MVRAEQVVLSVPDGRSVRLLVNATPIRSADGATVSMVVTLQDLAPLEGAGVAAGRLPGDGELRPARAAHLHQGLDGDRAARLAGPGPRRGPAGLPDHRHAGRLHGRPDR